MLINVVDDPFVFFWFDTAGAVHEASAGLQELNRCLYYPTLQMLHSREILWRQAPSDICSSTDNPGIRARRIDQDRIERFRLERRRVLEPVCQDNCAIADAKANQILLE